MDPEQQRIEEDLRGLLHGDVRCDDLTTQLYASDASLYEIRPLGVVLPRTTGDVVATMRYAAENRLPVVARGAGTGLAGESLGRGLIVDFSRYLRRILGDEGQFVTVQPGVVHASLNRYLARSRRLFGPDPAMQHVTTMGGVVAIDAGGSHWPAYGSARRHVESLEIVLADGTVVEAGRHRVRARPVDDPEAAKVQYLVNSIAGLIETNERVIREWRPQSLVNRSGYQLHDVLRDGELDLAKLLVGSEGTLALITQIKLAVSPQPLEAGCVLLLFDSLDKAARAVLELEPLGVAACDLMDRRHVNLARETDVRYELLLPGEAEALLLVEQHAESREELAAKIDDVVETALYKSGLAAGAHIASDESEFQLYWGLARRFVSTLQRMQGSSRPTPGIEDIAVPPAALPVFLRHVQDSLKRFHVTASVFGHAMHGQLHIRPFLDPANGDDLRKLEELASELYEKVWLLRGTISGEHGDGLSRTPFLARQYGPLVNVFRELKQIFDHHGLLNPGKKVPIGMARLTHHVRPVELAIASASDDREIQVDSEVKGGDRVELQLNWSAEEIALEARACNGCGICRQTSLETRMCPIFHLAPREESSPRAKANLMRGILTGALPAETLLEDATKEVADLCVHCHMCRLECPANVDIPKLMTEAKAAYVRTNGINLTDWFLSRIDLVSSIASRMPGAANWALSNPQMRWLLEKGIGIAQGRRLPRLARRSFMRQAAMQRLHRLPRTAAEKVIFFVDTYANYYDTQLAQALVAVMKHNGIGIFVPDDQSEAGMPMVSQGMVEAARDVAAKNVAALAESVRRGFTIVATEPSAVLALTHEYPVLLDDDDDALLVANHTQEACHYLWQTHQRGRLRLDFRQLRVSVGYHVPCHLRALGVGAPAENLMRLVPGIRVTRVEKGCSGIAGLYGVKHDNYRASLRAGLPLITTMRKGPFQIGMTECSTCKMQMEQSSTKPTLHPIKLLALAYGIMPEIADQLRPNPRRRVEL